MIPQNQQPAVTSMMRMMCLLRCETCSKPRLVDAQFGDYTNQYIVDSNNPIGKSLLTNQDFNDRGILNTAHMAMVEYHDQYIVEYHDQLWNPYPAVERDNTGFSTLLIWEGRYGLVDKRHPSCVRPGLVSGQCHDRKIHPMVQP